MITSGYAAREDAPTTKRIDPERPMGPTRATPGREQEAADCNAALAVLAPYLDEQTMIEARKSLIRSGVIYVEKDGGAR